MGKSICNKCGAIQDDLDVGFSLATQGMSHGNCGGKFVDYAAYLMGKKKSPKKSASSRENGKKGGRPKRWVVKGVQGNILSRHATEGGAERAAQKYCNEYITDNRLTRDTWSNHGFRVQKIDD